eukprot:1366120-Rhodomonas_salina.4
MATPPPSSSIRELSTAHLIGGHAYYELSRGTELLYEGYWYSARLCAMAVRGYWNLDHVIP